jgi:hypothetical protein
MDDGHNKEQHVIGQRDFDFNINCSFAVRAEGSGTESAPLAIP